MAGAVMCVKLCVYYSMGRSFPQVANPTFCGFKVGGMNHKLLKMQKKHILINYQLSQYVNLPATFCVNDIRFLSLVYQDFHNGSITRKQSHKSYKKLCDLQPKTPANI